MVEYAVVKIPKALVDKIDEIIGHLGFTSRAEFVKEAVRRLMTQLSKEDLCSNNHC